MELTSLIGFLYAIVAFVLVLIPAIIIHELGHLLAAKAVGINVLEFGIGFPPRVVRLFRWGETDFTLNWIPLGGFVRPLGEDMIGPVDKETAEEKAKNDGDEFISERDELIARGVPAEKLKSVNEAKPLQRIVFMAAGALANFASAFVFLIIVALLGLPQFLGARAQIIELDPTSPLAAAGVQRGDAIEQINGSYFATLEEFAALYAAADDVVELQMRSLETQEAYTVQVWPEGALNQPEVLVLGVATGAPADGKLQPEDVITHIGGQAFEAGTPAAEQLTRYVAENAGREITLGVRRGAEAIEVKITPQIDPPPGQGRMGVVIANLINTGDLILTQANPQTELIPQPLDQSVAYAFNQMRFVFHQIISLPSLIAQGRIDPEMARPVSIVGISQIGGRFLQQSVDEGRPGIILEFVALVSIFLGITNLLPIPPLDGGRIVFVLIEMVRGKPVPQQVEMTIYKIGLLFLLLLGILVIFWDILRPIQIP